MPVSPDKVKTFNQLAVDRAVSAIDARLLSNSDVVNLWNHDNNSIDFIIPSDGLENDERKELERLYTNVGWHSVSTSTSEEKGERPGLLRIRLVKG